MLACVSYCPLLCIIGTSLNTSLLAQERKLEQSKTKVVKFCDNQYNWDLYNFQTKHGIYFWFWDLACLRSVDQRITLTSFQYYNLKVMIQIYDVVHTFVCLSCGFLLLFVCFLFFVSFYLEWQVHVAAKVTCFEPLFFVLLFCHLYFVNKTRNWALDF